MVLIGFSALVRKRLQGQFERNVMAMPASSRTAPADGRRDSERSPFARLAELLAPFEPGQPLITMSLGEPQHAVPDFVAPVLAASVKDFGRYPPVPGTPAFRAACGAWRLQAPCQAGSGRSMRRTRKVMRMAVRIRKIQLPAVACDRWNCWKPVW